MFDCYFEILIYGVKNIPQTIIAIQNSFSHQKKKRHIPLFSKNPAACLFCQYILWKDKLMQIMCCYYYKRELLLNKCTLLEAEKTQESVDKNNPDAGLKPVLL